MSIETEIPDQDTGEQSDRYRAPALDKGLDILEVLAEQPRGLTRAEIVRELGLGPSQIYRMLERLVARGYVTRIDGDRYALTMKLFVLATRYPPVRRLAAQAQPLMDAFARDQRQSCHLVVPGEGAGLIIAQASPHGHFEFRARIGGELDLFHTGSGITLIAFQNEARRLETLGFWGVEDAAARLKTIGDDIARTRRAGARIAASAQLKGVTDMSVPVLGPKDEAIAVVTCAYMEHPDDAGPETDAALAALRALAGALSSPGLT